MDDSTKNTTYPTEYKKTFRKVNDHLTHQINKGLIVSDTEEAIKVLEQIGYYRIKIYLVPLYKNSSTKAFKEGATFEQAVDYYRFDEALRQLLFGIISRLEVKLRTRLDQHIAFHTKDPFWYLNDELFEKKNLGGVKEFRKKLEVKFLESGEGHGHDNYAQYFKMKYLSPSIDHQNLPPFWAAKEFTTFGSIMKLYSFLNKAAFGRRSSNVLNSLAQDFGAETIKVLNSWIAALHETRNRCAHHSRLWNRIFKAPQKIEREITYTSTRKNKIYAILVTVKVMSDKLKMGIDLQAEIQSLLDQYPIVNNSLESMGFPTHWQNDTVWLTP